MTVQEEIEKKREEIRKLEEEIKTLENLSDKEIFLRTPLKDLDDFNKGIVSALRFSKIFTVYDLINNSEKTIANIRNIGSKKLEILNSWLAKHDLQFLN